MLDTLSDDLLHRVLLHPRPPCATRIALLRVSRRIAAIVRADTTLWVELSCSAWPTRLPGIGRIASDNGMLIVPIAIGVDADTLPSFSFALRAAIEIVRLAYRCSAAQVGVKSLRLQRHSDRLDRILPPLCCHIAAHRGPCHEVTLTQCSLPPSLGRLLAHVRALRVWDCPIMGESFPECKGLAESLAVVPLHTLVWVSERQHVPLELLETRRVHPLEHLVLSIDHMALETLDGVNEGGSLDWVGATGTRLQTLALLTSAPLPMPAAAALLSALPTWTSLVTLHLGAEALCSLAHQCTAGERGAATLFEALPPTLEALGVIDCSWLAPTWFFDALAMARPRTHGGPPPLSHLRRLSLFINSPGTMSADMPTLLGLRGAGEHWGAASFEDGCASHQIAARVATAPFGAHLEKLVMCAVRPRKALPLAFPRLPSPSLASPHLASPCVTRRVHEPMTARACARGFSLARRRLTRAASPFECPQRMVRGGRGASRRLHALAPAVAWVPGARSAAHGPPQRELRAAGRGGGARAYVARASEGLGGDGLGGTSHPCGRRGCPRARDAPRHPGRGNAYGKRWAVCGGDRSGLRRQSARSQGTGAQ